MCLWWGGGTGLSVRLLAARPLARRLHCPAHSLNVPYGDYFTTEEMWVVSDVGARFNIPKHETASPADVAVACAQVRGPFNAGKAAGA